MSTAPTASAAADLLAELRREGKTTRRVLERVPQDRLDWKPHPKSMTLGQLAGHVAGIPGNMARLAAQAGHDVSKSAGLPSQPEAGTDFGASLDAGLTAAGDLLSGWSEGEARSTWRLTHGEREVFAIPRAQMVRTMLLNHWYHHRGQLFLYMRMLGLAVPAVYGRSADETLFGPPTAGSEAAAEARAGSGAPPSA